MNTATQRTLVAVSNALFVYDTCASGMQNMYDVYVPDEIEHVELAPAPSEGY